MTATLETLTCPTWCTRIHTPMEFDIGDVVHDCTAATSPIGDIIIDQMVLSEGRPADYAPEILLPEKCDDNIDAATARQFAGALNAAAGLLDSINAQASK